MRHADSERFGFSRLRETLKALFDKREKVIAPRKLQRLDPAFKESLNAPGEFRHESFL